MVNAPRRVSTEFFQKQSLLQSPASTLWPFPAMNDSDDEDSGSEDSSSSSSSSSSPSEGDHEDKSSCSSSSDRELEILLLDQEWVTNGGAEPRRIPMSIDRQAKFADVMDLARGKLNHERETRLFEDEINQKMLRSEEEWEACVKRWEDGETTRRVSRVEQLAREAADRAASTKKGKLELSARIAASRTQIRGYEQIYELLEHPANIRGLEQAKEDLVRSVVRGLVPYDFADEVAAAAALAAWKMAEKSDILCEALLAAGTPNVCVALLRHEVSRREDVKKGRPNAIRSAKSRLDLEKGLQQLGLKELGGAHYPRRSISNDHYYHLFRENDGSVFCTRTELDACQATVGLLDALTAAAARGCSSSLQRLTLAAATSGLPAFLALSAETDAAVEARLMVASAMCRTVGESLDSRKAFLSRKEGLPLLCSILRPQDDGHTAPFLPLLAVATLSTLFRCESARLVADANQLASTFSCLIKRIQVTLDVIEHHKKRHAQVTLETNNTFPRCLSVDPTAGDLCALTLYTIEHACLATWGCAAALRERGGDALEQLYEGPIANWAKELKPIKEAVVVASTTPIKKTPAPRRSSRSSICISRRSSLDLVDIAPPIPRPEPPKPREETWPEVLVRVGRLNLPIYAPQASLSALGNALAGRGGPKAILHAGKTPCSLLDELTSLVESSPNLAVRVFAADALARSTSEESKGLESFYSGCFGSEKEPHHELADSRLAAVLNSPIDSHPLDSAISATLLNFAMNVFKGIPRPDIVLKVHVALINCKYSGSGEASMLQGTLRRGCLSLWALARCRENRRRLNELGAPLALTRALCGGARLVIKEIAVAALWLLACDERGAINVALADPSQSTPLACCDSKTDTETAKCPSTTKPQVSLSSLGALRTLVGIVNFDPQLPGYIPIITLAVGTLCKLAYTSDDLLAIVAAYSSHFVDALYHLAKGSFRENFRDEVDSAVTTKEAGILICDAASDVSRARRCARTLQLLSVNLTFRLGECSDGRKAIRDARGAKALEQISSLLTIIPDDDEMRAIGAFRTAKLACEPARRRALDESNSIARLAGNLRKFDSLLDLRLYSLHALLNLSTEHALQPKICKVALDILLQVAHSADEISALQPSTAAPLTSGSAALFCSDSFAGGESLLDNRESVLELSSVVSDIRQNPSTEASTERQLDLEARYAQSILANLSKNVQCRALMYEVQLAQVSSAISAAKKSNSSIFEEVPQDDHDNNIVSSVTETMDEIIDSRTLVEFLSGTKSRYEKRVNHRILEEKLTRKQLKRLKPYLFDPVSQLWEGLPPDASRNRRPLQPQPISLQSLSNKSSLGPSRSCHDATCSSELLADRRLPVGGSVSLSPIPQGVSSRSETSLSLRALARPRSPFRSSHRLGPAAGFGVAATPQGESRWVPRVVSCTRTGDDSYGEKHSPRLVELEPKTSYHRVRFDAPFSLEEKCSRTKRLPSSEPTPASLVKFKHAPGARLYTDLFPCFSFKVDGAPYEEEGGSEGKVRKPSCEECFFYYTSSIVCEAVDPGPAHAPAAPNTLIEMVQTMPELPPLQGPSVESLPKMFNPGWQTCPRMMRHALELSARTGVLGGVPTEPLRIFSRMVEKPPGEEEEEEEQWTVEKSIFASRKDEADSRAYYETPKVFRRTLDVDWKRLLNEERFFRFVKRNDEGVQAGESLEEEIAEIKAAFSKRYADILRVFDYYCASSSIVTKAAFSMSENCYNRFLKECMITDDSTNCTVEECGRIFVACNFESDKTTQESEINEDKALMRHEFIECLVRIAVSRFGHETKDVSDCIDRLFDEVIFANIADECKLDPDIFRRERFYSQDTESGYLPHARLLKIIYNKYSMMNPIQGKARFGLAEWTALLTDSRILGDMVTMREVRLSFWWSRMVVADEIKSRFKIMNHTWVEFLEAIGRIADMTSLPTDEDLQLVNAINMLDFKPKCDAASIAVQDRTKKRRTSAVWNTFKTRPLSDKVDKLCKLIIGRLAVKFKGNISAGGRRANGVVGTYITKQQLQQMTLD